MLETNIKNREFLINSLKEELIGPIHIDKSIMKPLLINEEQVILFHSKESFYNEFYYKSDTEEEIIKYPNTPITQYSTGMLFPKQIIGDDNDDEPIDASLIPSLENKESILDDNAQKLLESIRKRSTLDEQEHPDLLEGKDDNKPSSLAFTFYAENFGEKLQFKVKVMGGIYIPFQVRLDDYEEGVVSNIEKDIKDKGSNTKKTFQTQWWYRETVDLNVPNFEFQNFKKTKRAFIKRIVKYKHLTFEIQGFLRMIEHKKDAAFITISLKNISEDSARGAYQNILFQSELTVENLDGKAFSPYPTDLYSVQTDDLEELSNQLLYHNVNNYALGHGCSIGWDENNDKQITKIYTTFLPEHEITNITPDIKDENGNVISISMLDLADPSNNYQDIHDKLSVITEGYKNWIKDRKSIAKSFSNKSLIQTANRHLEDCKKSLNRMEIGLEYLKDEKVLKAFQLANLAMFLQQIVGHNIRTGYTEGRKTIFETREDVLYEIPSIDILRQLKTAKGKWRAFQISFLIMSIPSFIENNPDRNIADLIWFPTGGGKTEAYLGVSAFSMLYRRIKNQKDASTDIIMRYTLRLLTADQFQRSARLICSLDMIRQQNINLLGNVPYSIGIWLGSSTTPNKNKDAQEQLKEWDGASDDTKAFLVKSCPWCGSKLGKYKAKVKNNNFYNNTEIVGYKYNTRKKLLEIHCPDSKCKFHTALPIYLVDETIYNVRPTFIIGTVDKFAMLAWEPKARNIFGIDEHGNRILSPPNLIIQDELHLISGPLGSAVGLYEVLIEELCTDRRSDSIVKPKVICATATVRGFKEQIQALYAKSIDSIRLFPSPGITHDDSYFAQVHLDETGNPSRGRKYIGVASNIIGIQQLQVKTYTTLLQQAKQLENPDPFWSLLAFYNSIRELGGSLTLFQTDISNYTLQFRNKHHITRTTDLRYLNNIKELTSRLSNGEVTDAIGELKKKYPDKSSIDVCLASNIIEVGVDIDRLSLMSIVGQPKNTAQYIQVSGRIGRAWYERPGLVITLYKLSMSRDKSHFEHFKEYHQSLYAHVEATSITPFSEPSLRRGLYGLIIAWLRQLFDQDIADSPKNLEKYSAQLNSFKELLGNRIRLIDQKQEIYFKKLFDDIITHMIKSEAQLWKKSNHSNDYFLMYSAGSYVEWESSKTARPVLTSMRNVDASCMGTVTNEYGLEEDLHE